MRRATSFPRPGWQSTVRNQGLVFWETAMPDGTTSPYWCEDACYEFSPSDIDYLEATTERLYELCIGAVEFLASGAMGDLGLPAAAFNKIQQSFAKNDPTLYGRFDVRWDGKGDAKLLEFNADTPTGLLESSVIQWYWLEDTYPAKDQWNSIHERLIQAWQSIDAQATAGPWYFAHWEGEPTGEELMTVTYLADTAEQAGLKVRTIAVQDIGFDSETKRFVGEGREHLGKCFKLYPWEDMYRDEFAAHLTSYGPSSTLWIEPAWKAVLSNKALLAALWHLNPGHPNLLEAYLDDPGSMQHWVAKPLHGREGSGIVTNTRFDSAPIDPAERYCYQQWCPLPSFQHRFPVLGLWVVQGKAAGLGVRESSGWLTDTHAQFLPHVIDVERPDEATQQAWLAE